MWSRINEYYPPWLEIIPAVCWGFALYYTYAHFALLPDQIPTHFGISGLPDDWSAKGFWSVYMIPVLGVIIWLSMAIMNYYFLIRPVDPGKFINLTCRQKEILGPEKLESIRIFTARGMVLLNLTMAAMLVIVQYGFINTALGIQKGLSFTVDVFAIALLAETIGLTVKLVSMTSTLKSRR